MLPIFRQSSYVQRKADTDYCASLDAPLLRVGKDALTLGQLCEGVLVLGGTGSGKSSSTGAYLAKSLLLSGAGGMVLCVKPEERAIWERYARECGRSDSLIIFDDSGKVRFNFLDFELRREGGGETMNIVSLFLKIAEAGKRGKNSSGSEDSFWETAVQELLSHTVDMLKAAYGTLRLADLERFIGSMPSGENAAETGFCYKTCIKALEDPVNPLSQHDFETIDAYIFQKFRYLNDRTKSSILAHWSGIAHPFSKGRMHELFCTHTTFVPELTHHGMIIIVDLSLKEWETVGIIAQSLLKYMWQKSVERRDVNANPRPVFLFVDEAQFFLDEYDNHFQSTARSARAISVYLTQNISGIYKAVGGKNPEHAANALLGNLRTVIFHSNANTATNQWAVEMIGKRLHRRKNWSRGRNNSRSIGESEGSSSGYGGGGSSSPQGGSSSSSWNRGWNYGVSVTDSQGTNLGEGESEQMDYKIQPDFFSHLRTGGKANKKQVDAVVFQPSRRFSTEENYTLCTFTQKY